MNAVNALNAALSFPCFDFDYPRTSLVFGETLSRSRGRQEFYVE